MSTDGQPRRIMSTMGIVMTLPNISAKSPPPVDRSQEGHSRAPRSRALPSPYATKAVRVHHSVLQSAVIHVKSTHPSTTSRMFPSLDVSRSSSAASSTISFHSVASRSITASPESGPKRTPSVAKVKPAKLQPAPSPVPTASPVRRIVLRGQSLSRLGRRQA